MAIDPKLADWLKAPRTDLKDAVRECVRAHVRQLKQEHADLYGYALLPGDEHEVSSLVAVWNRERDVTGDEDYERYSVDEWEHWDHEGLEAVTPLIERYNEAFEEWEDEAGGDAVAAHVGAFHEAFLAALRELVAEGELPPGEDGFVTIWIPDSTDEIVSRSVRELNAAEVWERFEAEFLVEGGEM